VDTVALVTCAAYPDLTPDDRLLGAALARAGFDPVARSWDAPGEPWESHSAVVLRSTWDYHLRLSEFLGWLEALERRGARVLNPVPVIRWNATKTYLPELAEAGVRVVPTEVVPAGAATRLREAMDRRRWRDVVVKPAVSATAFETWRVAGRPAEHDEARFARLLEERAMMVQPYVAGIEADGELSLMFLGGEFSHAVRKRPGSGDFRVQHEFGGTVEAVEAGAELVAEAATIVARAPGSCVYARVDGCVVEGRLLLMELELIEPALFLGLGEGSAERLAAAIRCRVGEARVIS
jgi:glutathione synthase/RimK-type ligase-like ATP-grasp enzyme